MTHTQIWDSAFIPQTLTASRLLGLNVWGSRSLRVPVSIPQERVRRDKKDSAVDVMDEKEILKNTKAREESVRRDKISGIVATAQPFLQQPSCSQQLLRVILMVSFGGF